MHKKFRFQHKKPKDKPKISKTPTKTSIAMKKKLLFFMMAVQLILAVLVVRIFYLQAFEADFLQKKAYEQQTRDRLVSPDRGSIYDRNMQGLAVTETVSSISVIRAQIQEPEIVAKILSDKLELDYEATLAKVKKRVALERIMRKVDKKTADEIREYNLPGVIVDEDIKRVYPYSSLAAQVIGFVGKDNQGIVGLEAKYDKYLQGKNGKILTETDARGVEIKGGSVIRIEPERGQNLVTSIDVIVQQYAEQTIKKIVETKSAKRGAILLMNPQNGEILAMANEPTFDLNNPFEINSEALLSIWESFTEQEKTNYLNQMWRNFTINDTYEPGSTFKVVTSAAGLSEGVIALDSKFTCTGSYTVGGRAIKCWRSPRNHGAIDFVQGVQNSCNPVFMITAERLGAEKYYEYMLKFGVSEKTGVDLPGEAVGIMHKLDKVGPVELATMSFGQSFQITPLQLLRAASATINGGYLVTPHIGTQIIDSDGAITEVFNYDGKKKQIITAETSETMKEILESVVEFGTGNRTYLPGYRIGGKTATSEKLPRRSGKYISSFLAFAPAENPKVIALVLVDEPQGAYYGGQVTGPVMKELLENTLPYLNIAPEYSEEELKMKGIGQVAVPDLTGQDIKTAKKTLATLKLGFETKNEGSVITYQFPIGGELVNQGSKLILYLGEPPAAETPEENR